MKKYSEIRENSNPYDFSNSKKLLEEAMERLKSVKDEFSRMSDVDIQELEEGWNLIDKYYGNVVRGEIFKRKKNKGYIPNTSAVFPRKGDS